jgi:predicted RNase H-like nuclease (RuvC/YqgF family)
MIINYSGYVGFGIGPLYPLHMASGARVTVGGVWTNASSRDYKEDIQELSAAAAMSTLRGLNPVTFKYKAGEEEQHVGFIAEDVPELVASSDRKGMSPMDVVAVLTKVVKEQQDTVSQQQQALQEQNKVVASQQEAIQHQEQITKEQQQINKEQQQANQELMKKVSALEAEVNSLKQSASDGRLARIAN